MSIFIYWFNYFPLQSFCFFLETRLFKGRLHFCQDELEYLPRWGFFQRFFSSVTIKLGYTNTVWNVSKYGVFSGPYFPILGLNTGKYGPEKTPYLNTFHAVCEYFNGFWLFKILSDTSYLSVFGPNAGKYGLEKTPYLDTFQAVQNYTEEFSFIGCPISIFYFFTVKYYSVCFFAEKVEMKTLNSVFFLILQHFEILTGFYIDPQPVTFRLIYYSH